MYVLLRDIKDKIRYSYESFCCTSAKEFFKFDLKNGKYSISTNGFTMFTI